ncbi:cytochrome c oxidase cbb3-type subunit 4 [Roseivivax lentus]|uniref:Cytochrome c oxidase cbb3-type subunit 4 n=1 Tax=Roseivivax lentus TaxID=633194 RepID=A0A1N7MR59_9RHOB|nr:cbb3-type cytochrome c oxidase subunit 3 [Roseivivax lentus]SIS88552.1 cytochrome c oxidase cbb3-type subunit 4 [Roseivivax lentus]
METYSFLRQLADSWVLLALFTVFLGVIVWAFRPGSRPLHDDAARTVFRNDDAPRGAEGHSPTGEPK